MNNIKQALESAIEALNLINNHAFRCGIAYDAIKACKAALTEVEASSTNKNSNVLLDKYEPQQQWVGLSDDEIDKMWEFYRGGWYDFAMAIEAKLKELNT